jgi:hypothetical protein
MMKPLGKLSCVAIILAAGPLHAQMKGTISATVIDQTGQPLVGARVAMVPADATGLMGALPECLTDDRGVCSLNLRFGKYHVTAKKVAEGYPDLTIRFYGHGQWPATAEITPEAPAASVTVDLGPKAASLVLHPVDDDSGDNIKHLTVTLHPANDPHEFISSSLAGPNPTILVPPDEDVLVTVSADGYQPWHLEEHSELSSRGVLNLHSRDKQEINARLKHQ